MQDVDAGFALNVSPATIPVVLPLA